MIGRERIGASFALAGWLAGVVPGAAADVARGERVFQRCYACHSIDPAEEGLPGPNLAGVVGRRIAAQADFDYSPALKALGATGAAWTPDRLDRFILDPQTEAPGTLMTSHGLRDQADRADLIAYLSAHAGP